jgi:leucyl aminopeptidase
LARWLTTLPPNELTCGSYRRTLQQLASREGWDAEFLNLAALKKRKAGAFLAVARANANNDAGIMRLTYRAASNRRKQHRKLCLVGKGICFDTGGINLKTHKGMYDMHTDMQGSAVAVGTLLALSQLNANVDIECWLALTENEIGPNAYRPQEVITAANGTTIQVVHSDAEGRMVLADTLALATQHQPDLLIDFATLTGACVAALTERMSGAFSNRRDLRDPIEHAGRSSGERVWSFPMDADFDSDLDSPIADIMQCTMDNKGDHILAARFLSRFVPDSVPWVHIDLSSASKAGGLAHIPSEITGFGVRWAVEFVTHHAFK